MIGGLIRSSFVLFLISSCFAIILYPEPREYTFAQLPRELVGYVSINTTCSGNVSLVYDGNVVLKKFVTFDTGTLVAYNSLFNFSIPKEVGNHTIEILSDCFSPERVDYSVTNKIPVVVSYNTNKLMVGDEFRLNVFGEHVTIRFNNRTFYTTSFNHTFEKPGNYTIEVEVWDEYGDYNRKMITVIVSDQYFLNYSFNPKVVPGGKLIITYALYDFFGRNLTRSTTIYVFGKNFTGNGTLIISVPEDMSPGNYTLYFSYRDYRVNTTLFVSRVLKLLDLSLDKVVLDKDEPIRTKIVALDQTGNGLDITCGLEICGDGCKNISVPANTEVLLTGFYWKPGYYRITAYCMNKTSVEHLFVPRIQDLKYNYSTEGNITLITLKNTGNTDLNTTITYCYGGTCSKLNVFLKKNQTKTISLRNPEAVTIRYADKRVSLPITGSFVSIRNPWLLYVFLVVIFILFILVLFMRKMRSTKGK